MEEVTHGLGSSIGPLRFEASRKRAGDLRIGSAIDMPSLGILKDRIAVDIAGS